MFFCNQRLYFSARSESMHLGPHLGTTSLVRASTCARTRAHGRTLQIGRARVQRRVHAQAIEWLCQGLYPFRLAFGFHPAEWYAWKDKFCMCIVAIWPRPWHRLRLGALGWKCQIYSTMAITVTDAKHSGYVPRNVAEEIKKRNKQQRKAAREKQAREKETRKFQSQAGLLPLNITNMTMSHPDGHYSHVAWDSNNNHSA